MARVGASAIMELLKTTSGGSYISFASGLPDPALYPVERLREITEAVLAADGRAALQYGAAEGYAPLREYVAAMLRGRGLAATPEHVLITNGSQQALDLFPAKRVPKKLLGFRGSFTQFARGVDHSAAKRLGNVPAIVPIHY